MMRARRTRSCSSADPAASTVCTVLRSPPRRRVTRRRRLPTTASSPSSARLATPPASGCGTPRPTSLSRSALCRPPRSLRSSVQAQQPPESIGRRLAQTAQMRFVGRRAELAQFETALQEPSPPFAVLHVHGVGGVGKSTLLREFARLAKDAGRAVIALDGRDVQASRQEFPRAFAEARSDAPDGKFSLPAAGAVVLIDTYEALHALDGWLRESFLPRLPARTLVVLAGRNVPALAWRTDVAWAPLARIL